MTDFSETLAVMFFVLLYLAIIVLFIAWEVILPVIGLLYVCGYIGAR